MINPFFQLVCDDDGEQVLFGDFGQGKERQHRNCSRCGGDSEKKITCNINIGNDTGKQH